MSTRGQGLAAYSWTLVIVALSLSAWLALLMFMGGMDDGSETPLQRLPFFLAGWVVMLTAMMLPTELNYIVTLAAIIKLRDITPVARIRLMLCFIAGYTTSWVAYGLVAYFLNSVFRVVCTDLATLNGDGPMMSGYVLIFAGLYQVSALKQACLKGCRSPLAFFAQHWDEGEINALTMGIRHGIVCLGCCWAMMAVMFTVSIMSLTWMALLTLIMFAEKMLPKGRALTIPIACFLWVMGTWIIVSPETAPLLNNSMVFSANSHPRH